MGSTNRLSPLKKDRWESLSEDVDNKGSKILFPKVFLKTVNLRYGHDFERVSNSVRRKLKICLSVLRLRFSFLT